MHDGFHVFFYSINPITMFPCAPFSDIQALKHEFPNLYFPASSMICISVLCFDHIANISNDILSILKELIIFPENDDLFRIGKTNMNTLRPKFDFFLRIISL